MNRRDMLRGLTILSGLSGGSSLPMRRATAEDFSGQHNSATDANDLFRALLSSRDCCHDLLRQFEVRRQARREPRLKMVSLEAETRLLLAELSSLIDQVLKRIGESETQFIAIVQACADCLSRAATPLHSISDAGLIDPDAANQAIGCFQSTRRLLC